MEIFFIWDRKRARERLLTSATLAHPNHQQSTVNHQPISVTFGNLRKPTVTYGRRCFAFPRSGGQRFVVALLSLPGAANEPNQDRQSTVRKPIPLSSICAYYRLLSPDRALRRNFRESDSPLSSALCKVWGSRTAPSLLEDYTDTLYKVCHVTLLKV